ncbi:hypothetical protein CsatA_018074 [Cannabis sativa]
MEVLLGSVWVMRASGQMLKVGRLQVGRLGDEGFGSDVEGGSFVGGSSGGFWVSEWRCECGGKSSWG